MVFIKLVMTSSPNPTKILYKKGRTNCITGEQRLVLVGMSHREVMGRQLLNFWFGRVHVSVL